MSVSFPPAPVGVPEVVLDAGGSGASGASRGGASGPGRPCSAVAGAGLDGRVRRLEEAGIEIEADFRWPNGVRSICRRDPAGNSLELAEPKLWERAT